MEVVVCWGCADLRWWWWWRACWQGQGGRWVLRMRRLGQHLLRLSRLRPHRL
jgi:hypothetical protein